jgi:hypothetical protein
MHALNRFLFYAIIFVYCSHIRQISAVPQPPPPGFLLAQSFVYAGHVSQVFQAIGGYTYFIEACGALGSNSIGANLASDGGCIYCQFTNPTSKTWHVVVGGRGAPMAYYWGDNPTYGFNGGLYGGGGASDIRLTYTTSSQDLGTRFIVGGAGGGSGNR